MKKQIVFIALLSTGLAFSQVGKVGINNADPKATLDIQVSEQNKDEKTNEGILIPRLGKKRVAEMENPTTSTLLYINNVSDYTVENSDTPTAKDIRVAKVDKVGFYHYNGTQWVRVVDAETNEDLWTQKESNGVVETYLKPANEKGDFVGYKYQKDDSSDEKKYRNFAINMGSPTADDFKDVEGNAPISTDYIPFSTNVTSDILPKTGANNKTIFFNRNSALIRGNHATTAGTTYYGGEYRLVARDVADLGNIGSLRGLLSTAELLATGTTGKANNIIGFEAITRSGSQKLNFTPSVANNIAGQFAPRSFGATDNLMAIKTVIHNYGMAANIRGIDLTTNSFVSNTAHIAKSIRGIDNKVKLMENATLQTELVNTYNTVEVSKNTTTPNGANIRGIYNRVFINGDNNTTTSIGSAITNYTSTLNTNGTSTITEYVDYSAYPNAISENTSITNYIGFRVNTGSSTNKMKVQNMYGVKVDNIEKGSNNYAIHTGEQGKVRIGTLKGSGDRAVYADADGVLKTASGGMQVGNDASKTTCDGNNAGLMQYKDLTDASGKTAGVLVFCVKNGNGTYSWVYLASSQNGVSISNSGTSNQLGDNFTVNNGTSLGNGNSVDGSGSGAVGD